MNLSARIACRGTRPQLLSRCIGNCYIAFIKVGHRSYLKMNLSARIACRGTRPQPSGRYTSDCYISLS